MRLRKRRGQALVEFALVVPILIAFLGGLVAVGWLYNHQMILTNATREGARLGSLGDDETEIRAAVMDYLDTSHFSPMPDAADINVDLSGDAAVVTIETAVPAIFGITGTPEVELIAETQMRLE